MISRKTKQTKPDSKDVKKKNYTKNFEKHWEYIRELRHPNKTLHGYKIMRKLNFKNM